jgi:hypothetical protein
MEYFVIRDPDRYGDVATVWNYKRREWCWDLDGDYNAADGFAYTTREAAKVRASMVVIQEDHNRDVLAWKGRTPAKNVRVVTRAAFNVIREQRRD